MRFIEIDKKFSKITNRFIQHRRKVEGIDVFACVVADTLVGVGTQRYKNGSLEGVYSCADNFTRGRNGRLGNGTEVRH